jgi:medium-chain acyl-[acyl-carrier-protein] hydrolase
MNSDPPLAIMAVMHKLWVGEVTSQRAVDLRLFCFPYAGGTASVYREWPTLLPPTVQVVPVELPGRSRRICETAFVSLPALIETLGEVLPPYLDVPFAFFGHSMGASIAFEMARFLRRKYRKSPELLVVSGRHAPQIPNEKPAIYNLPTAELVRELTRLQGTPREVIQSRELMELMIPLLRADFQLTQTYEYLPEAPLESALVAFGGTADPEVTTDGLLPWASQTRRRFALHMFPGDHFFLRTSQPLLLEVLARELMRAVESVNQRQRRAEGRARTDQSGVRGAARREPKVESSKI